MKLDKEIFHKTQGQKPDIKTFDYKDDPLGSTGLKSGNTITKEDQKWISRDWKESERDVLQLRFLMDDEDALAAAELRLSKSVDEIKTCKEFPTNELVVPYTKSPNKMESMNSESEYYTDKSLMEYDELPEFLVCYRENYHSVKDICVDEGVPQDKILFDSGVNQKAVCSFLFLDKDPNEHTIKEDRELHMPIVNCLNSSEERDSDNELAHLCELLDTSVEREDEYDKAHNLAEDVSKDKVSLGEILSMKEGTIDNSHLMSSKKDENAAQPQISQIAMQETYSESSALVPGAEESNNCTNEAFGSITSSYAAKQSKTNNFVNGLLSYNSKIISSQEFGSVAETREDWLQNGFYGFHQSKNWSFDDDGSSNSHVVSSQVQQETKVEEHSQNDVLGNHETLNTFIMVDEVTSDSEIVSRKIDHDMVREECPKNIATESCETQNMLIVEDGISSLQEAFSNQDQNGQGEASFSGMHRLSSLINYSGPMASGNVSLRSESSTTSTRSFAFPILQPEWNSSPVRMAKGDRRYLRKHGGWRKGLLCCRF